MVREGGGPGPCAIVARATHFATRTHPTTHALAHAHPSPLVTASGVATYARVVSLVLAGPDLSVSWSNTFRNSLASLYDTRGRDRVRVRVGGG